MAVPHGQSPIRRLLRFLLRHWRGILFGTLKGFVVFTVAVFMLDFTLSSYAKPSERLTAVFVLTLFAAALAYLVFVSSRVRLDFPGIDERDLESEGSESEGNDSILRKARRALFGPHSRGRRQAVMRTVQVSRLSSDFTRITVVNDSPLPVLRAELALQLIQEPDDGNAPSEQEVKLVRGKPFSLPAHGSQIATASHAFNHVGIYQLHSAGVCIHGLLGLLSRVRGSRGHWRVRVVPNLYRLALGIPRDRKLLQDSLGIPDSPSDSLDYDRVRDYRPGDPLKTIHWKIVAHGQGELYTKLFETATITTATLVVDPLGPPRSTGSNDSAYHLHDTMLEGGFSLIEHARESGIATSLRFLSRSGSLIETNWEGPASLGWFVETAQRPWKTPSTASKSALAIRSLRDRRAGYVVFATSWLTDESVRELIACHNAGVSFLVVHALPTRPQSEANLQRSLDGLLREASVPVIQLTDGPQIIREASV